MRSVRRMIDRLFVRRFYAQNSGFFLFLFVLLFGIVETLTDSLLIEFHYRLIMGMLGNNLIFSLVLGLWLLYQFKCFQFVNGMLAAPELSFFREITLLPPKKLFIQLFRLQVILYLPVLGYSIAILGVALYKQYLVKAILILVFHSVTCLLPAIGFLRKIPNCGNPGRRSWLIWHRNIPRPYFSFLLSYLATHLKFLYFGIKTFTCLLLIALLKSLELGDYDFRLILLIYTMALIGNGVTIYKLRYFEETRLSIYRQLPVSRFGRWLQYILFYLVFMIPESIVILHSAPAVLHYADALQILCYTLCFLLLQHAILSVRWMGLPNFLKILAGIYFALYFFILGHLLAELSLLLGLFSTLLFMGGYYQFALQKTKED